MRPGDSTSPDWRVRIKLEWNSAEDAHDVWVIQDEYDTDGSWLGLRVLDADTGTWRGWVTVEGAALGDPTQTVKFAWPPTGRPFDGPYAAAAAAGVYSTTATASPPGMVVGDTITITNPSASSPMFMLGPPPAEGAFDGQKLSGTDGKLYRWVKRQKRWLRA